MTYMEYATDLKIAPLCIGYGELNIILTVSAYVRHAMNGDMYAAISREYICPV